VANWGMTFAVPLPASPWVPRVAAGEPSHRDGSTKAEGACIGIPTVGGEGIDNMGVASKAEEDRDGSNGGAHNEEVVVEEDRCGGDRPRGQGRALVHFRMAPRTHKAVLLHY